MIGDMGLIKTQDKYSQSRHVIILVT